MGWSTAKAASQNAAFYADAATVTLQHGETLTLYAILYKLDETSGDVTLPGKDGEPNTTDDVTVTPPKGGTITPGNGFVTAPSGSEIKLPGGNKVTVTTGPVHVYPDGSVYVPEGSKVTDKGGSEVTGPAAVSYTHLISKAENLTSKHTKPPSRNGNANTISAFIMR